VEPSGLDRSSSKRTRCPTEFAVDDDPPLRTVAPSPKPKTSSNQPEHCARYSLCRRYRASFFPDTRIISTSPERAYIGKSLEELPDEELLGLLMPLCDFGYRECLTPRTVEDLVELATECEAEARYGCDWDIRDSSGCDTIWRRRNYPMRYIDDKVS
jgi:hypothetical protein